ncbi:MAG TPA: hypothetical protein VFH99_02880 [Candidatus Saccharimonadales bacterium]|nr:hypothetical protein [Candidatus Saccharimonadales bacterium]
MNPQDANPQPPSQPSPQLTQLPQIHNPLEVTQPGEQTICEIKRHPIGMFGVYSMGGILLLVFAVLAFVVAPGIDSDHRGPVMTISSLIFLVIAGIVLAFVFIANKVYWGNSWVVTSDSLTQITQTSLFSRQSSQLSLGNLEDVTAEQTGIPAQLFRYGTLRVETAGERSKFVFPYCPNSNYYAQKILAAREAFEQAHHGGKQEPYSAPPVFPDAAPQ